MRYITILAIFIFLGCQKEPLRISMSPQFFELKFGDSLTKVELKENYDYLGKPYSRSHINLSPEDFEELKGELGNISSHQSLFGENHAFSVVLFLRNGASQKFDFKNNIQNLQAVGVYLLDEDNVPTFKLFNKEGGSLENIQPLTHRVKGIMSSTLNYIGFEILKQEQDLMIISLSDKSVDRENISWQKDYISQLALNYYDKRLQTHARNRGLELGLAGVGNCDFCYGDEGYDCDAIADICSDNPGIIDICADEEYAIALHNTSGMDPLHILAAHNLDLHRDLRDEFFTGKTKGEQYVDYYNSSKNELIAKSLALKLETANYLLHNNHRINSLLSNNGSVIFNNTEANELVTLLRKHKTESNNLMFKMRVENVIGDVNVFKNKTTQQIHNLF